MTSTAATRGAAPIVCPDDRIGSWIELASLLDRCSHRIREVLRGAAEPHGLSDRQVMILWLCATDPNGLAQNELARRLALSAPQLCHLLDQLRERGLLESIRDPSDRRRQCTRLTEQGNLLWREVESEIRGRLKHLAQVAPEFKPRESIESLRQLSQAEASNVNQSRREAA